MERGNREIETNEPAALLEWVNACPCMKVKYVDFMDLKDGLAIATILNDIDPLEFHIISRRNTERDDEACKQNLEDIIKAIVRYYDRTKGWELESNIPVDDIFLSGNRDPLVLILRWVITTILFSAKKTEYIQSILTLSPNTQYYLQLIIETVLNTFPQDDVNESAISDVHSILEESQFLYNHRSIPTEEDSLDIDNSRLQLRSHFEEEIRELESRVLMLQQSLAAQKEETELLRRQRDELQQEVTRLESEVAMQKEVVNGLEGQERRLSLEVEGAAGKYAEQIRYLQETNEQLTHKVELYSSENAHYIQEVEFLRTSKEDETRRYQKMISEYENELQKLKSEVDLLTSEKEYLSKSTEKMETLKQRVESLRAVESQFAQLKKDHESLQEQLETLQHTAVDDSATKEVKRLREEIGMLKGRLDAIMMERESLQHQVDQTREESNRLAEELKLTRLRSETQQAPSVQVEGAPLSVLLHDQPSNEQSLKEKIRGYIVENSELRIRLQKQQKQFEEQLQGKEDEYNMGKKTLEQEYKARLQETIDLREQLEAKERELMKHGATTADLQEVITNQNGEKETLEKELGSLRVELEESKRMIEEKERQYSDLKRKCDEFEAREEDDRKKRRDLEIEKRVIQREREVMRNTLFRKGSDVFARASSQILKDSRPAQFLRKSKQYE